MDKSKNLELWNSVCKTDPKHTKKAKISGMSITAIAPQHQILNATKEFGPYAVKWGFKSIEFDYSLINSHKLIVFKGVFFCPDGEVMVSNSAKIFMNRDETMVDADFAKKMETDALTKVLSKMGFNADVFMGRYDDHKYVSQMQQEFAEKPKPKQTKEEAIAFIKEAQTIDELLEAWKKISVDNKKVEDVLSFKDTRKEELTK